MAVTKITGRVNEFLAKLRLDRDLTKFPVDYRTKLTNVVRDAAVEVYEHGHLYEKAAACLGYRFYRLENLYDNGDEDG